MRGDMQIDSEMCLTLVKAAQLHKAAPDVLSAFQEETLWTVTQRALQLGDEAVVTSAEWTVIDEALLALQDALRKRGTSWAMQDGRCRIHIGPASAPAVLGEVPA